MSRLRILHSDTDDIENPLRGGQPVRTFEVNRRLAARHDITVFTAVYKGAIRRVERQGIRYRRLGFRVPGFGLSPHLTFLSQLGRAVSRTPHDLVVEEFTPPVGFCRLPWRTSAPVVSIVQWSFFDQWEKRYHLPFSKWMRRIAATGRYRHVIVQSEAMAREFHQLLPDATITTIPPGIDDRAFVPPSGPGEYILYLGRLDTQHKGLDLLLEAWARHARVANIPLHVAGDGPALPELRQRAQDKNVAHLVKFLGRLEGTAKASAFQGCRAMVVPSRYETFGISALEGMAASKPVVAFDIDHLNELVAAPWAVSVPAFDVDAFGRAVTELWAAPSRCAELGQAAQARARLYHWDEIARRQEDFYQSVYQSSHEPAQHSRLLSLGISERRHRAIDVGADLAKSP